MNTIKTFIFLFFMLVFHNSYSQSKKIKIEKLNNYIKKAVDFAAQKKFDSANYYSKKAQLLSTKISDLDLTAKMNYNSAKILYWQAKTTEAKKRLNQNIRNNRYSDSIKIRSLYLIAEIFFFEENYTEALNSHINIEKKIRKKDVYSANDSTALRSVLLQMGYIHEKANNIEKALKYYDNALLYCGNNAKCKNMVMYAKAVIYNEKNNFKNVINHSLRGIEISIKNKFNIYIPSYYLFISDAYISLKKGDSAIYYAKKGLDDNNHCRRELLFQNIGKGYTLQKKYKKSIAYFEKALGHSSEIQQIEIHKNMYDTYVLIKNYKKAIHHNKEYLTLKSADDSLQIRQQLLEITEKYDSDKNKLEIKMLQFENEKKNNQIVFVCISLILLSVFSLFIGFSYYKQKKHKNLLFIKNRQLAQKLKTNKKSLTIENSNQLKKTTTSNIDTLQKEKINTFIRKAILDEFYLDKNSSLSKLAKQANTNTTYLSKVINEDYKKSFALFINELRIIDTLKKLEALPNYKNLTIENIADKAGFSSNSAFYNAFKKFTGLTPSYYIKKRLLQDDVI